jgi:hypothetical protein
MSISVLRLSGIIWPIPRHCKEARNPLFSMPNAGNRMFKF